ncbi:MAG: hypothetical protein ACKPKO_50755, partial [Candidatus Fonsibacter sp.]
MLIARGMVGTGNDQEADAAAAWINEHGEQKGFRAPNVGERARAMGMAAYLSQLGLGDNELYDGQGNSFDPQAVLIRIQQGLRSWERGGPIARHEFPEPSFVAQVYEGVLQYVTERG